MSLKKQLLFIITIFAANLYGQEAFKDTVKLSLQQTDTAFVSQNLSLLAEKCNISAVRAQILQAKLFNNITISSNQNIVNPDYKTTGGRKWFDYTDKGETNFQVQKLFLLAGKRNKQIRMAEITADKEEQVYFDLLRTLKFSLRSDFYSIYYLQQILTVYDKEITALNKLIAVYQVQFEKGYISKKELLRLKSTLFSLENERIGFSSQLIGRETDFNVLMHTSNIFYVSQFDASAFDKFSPEDLKLQSLFDAADENRYDLKMVQSDLSLSQLNIAYQKSIAIPDLTLCAGWDRNGGFIQNYNYVGLQIDLPIFNRNQGNIKSAKFLVESNKYKVEGVENQLKADVLNAYANAVETNRLYNKFDKNFIADLNTLNDEMLKNFEKKNISLIEFLDYYDAYKQNAVQLNNLLSSRINSFETINFSVGKDIIK